jgi:IclR family transcriptional regulator, pca regulon regulatory protein
MVENGKSVVQSAAKAFAVLKAFDPNLPELTVTEIAARAHLDRGTAFRLARTLMELGYVRGVPGSKRYRLTLKCLELGFAALAGRDLPAHARPLLREVVPAVADAGSLGMLERGEVIYVERVQTVPERLGIDRRPGSRIGAYAAALGHAILAFLPRDEQIAHLQSVERVKLSERTLTGMEALLKRLNDVRWRGYAVSDGENAYGLRTVAAPIFDTGGQPLAGLSLTIQASRMDTRSFVAAALPQVQRIANELSESVRFSLGAISMPRHSR